MQDATTITHAASSNHDRGLPTLIQIATLLRCHAQVHICKLAPRLPTTRQPAGLIVKVVWKFAVDLCGADGHRAVKVNGDHWRATIASNLCKYMQQQLRATNCEAWYQHLALLPCALLKNRSQFRERLLGGSMVAIAIRGLQEHQVRGRARHGIAKDGHALLTNITGEHDGLGDAAFSDAEFNTCGPQDVSGILKACGDAISHFNQLLVLMAAHARNDGVHFGGPVQRHCVWRCTGPFFPAVFTRSVALLDLGRVTQDQFRQRTTCMRCVHCAGKTNQ